MLSIVFALFILFLGVFSLLLLFQKKETPQQRLLLLKVRPLHLKGRERENQLPQGKFLD